VFLKRRSSQPNTLLLHLVSRVQFFFIFLLLCACGTKTRIPNDVLQPAPMGKLLKDMHMVDAALAFGNPNPADTSRYLMAKPYYDQLFLRYGTNYKTFRGSLKFYVEHPELLDSIYDKIVANMESEGGTDTPLRRKEHHFFPRPHIAAPHALSRFH